MANISSIDIDACPIVRYIRQSEQLNEPDTKTIPYTATHDIDPFILHADTNNKRAYYKSPHRTIFTYVSANITY